MIDPDLSVELDKDVRVAIIVCFAADERAKHADPSSTERLEFGDMHSGRERKNRARAIRPPSTSRFGNI